MRIFQGLYWLLFSWGKAAFELNGIETETAGNGEEGLSLAREKSIHKGPDADLQELVNIERLLMNFLKY